MVSTSRYTLRQLLGRQMDGENTIVGTPDTGSGTDLAKARFGVSKLVPYSDDYFNDWHGRFYDGGHRDTDFEVTDFSSTDGIIHFSPALSEAVKTEDLFELYQNYTPAELNDAINLAISIVERDALQDKIDESIRLTESTYEYDIPSGFVYIEALYQESGTTGLYSQSDIEARGMPATTGLRSLLGGRIDERHWGNIPGPKIWFDPNGFGPTNNRQLRIVGQQVQPQLTKDSDLCTVSQAYIMYQAKALLHQSRIRGVGADFEGHERQMTLSQIAADRERSRIHIAARGQAV